MTKLKTFLETYNGEPVTVQYLASELGIAERTIYNNKSKYTSEGVVFTRKTKETGMSVEYSKEDLKSAKVSRSLYEAVYNHVSYALGSGYKYTPGKSNLRKNVSLSSCQKYLERCLKEETLLTDEDYLAAKTLILSLKGSSRDKGAHAELIKEVFKTKCNIKPYDEQVRCVSLMYQFIKQTEVTHPYKYVQARAGSSKSTCLRALSYLLEELGEEPIPFLTLTNKAVLELSNGSTVNHYLGSVFGRTVFDSSASFLSALTDILIQEGYKKKPVVFVDEYAMLDPIMVSVIKRLFERVVFVGDDKQLVRNEEYVGVLMCSLKKQPRFLNSKTKAQELFTEAYYKLDEEKMEKILRSLTVGSFEANIEVVQDGINFNSKAVYAGSFGHLENLLDGYKSLEHMIVCYSTSCRDELNTLLNEGSEIKVGSKVSLIKPIHKIAHAVPGTSWLVIELNNENAKLFGDNGVIIEVPVKNLRLAFAVTSMTAQGSASKHVLFVEGTSPASLRYRDTYVGITRATRTLKVIRRASVDDTKRRLVKSVLV